MKRSQDFCRNNHLESLLQDINNNMWQSEQSLLGSKKPPYPIIFVMGALRSGTTMMMQWLANTDQIAYPTNLLSRFYKAPIIGSKLQLLLTDERYQFRDELSGINTSIDYCSENGKTSGFLSPNEFWYFWRRFPPFDSDDYSSDEDLRTQFNADLFLAELAGVSAVFDKPFALKGMIANYNIGYLNEIIDDAFFIYIERDIIANVQSVINARIKQYGTAKHWYSFKIKEYPELENLHYIEQITSQIYFINKAIKKALYDIPSTKTLHIKYEDFCNRPEHYYQLLASKLNHLNVSIGENYTGEIRFNHTNQLSLSSDEISIIQETVAKLEKTNQ